MFLRPRSAARRLRLRTNDIAVDLKNAGRAHVIKGSWVVASRAGLATNGVFHTLVLVSELCFSVWGSFLFVVCGVPMSYFSRRGQALMQAVGGPVERQGRWE